MILDSNYSHTDCTNHLTCPIDIINQLTTISVEYFSFDQKIHQGQITVDKAVEEDVKKVFTLILELKFPVFSVLPIHHFQWDDIRSMAANNSSAFNYRKIAGTNTLSLHSFGRAVDINPVQNPWIIANDIHPPGAKYSLSEEGTLLKDSPIVQLFLELGWEWGGDWISIKDYHHFQKPLLSQ